MNFSLKVTSSFIDVHRTSHLVSQVPPEIQCFLTAVCFTRHVRPKNFIFQRGPAEYHGPVMEL